MIGENIRRLRQREGLTQAALAERLGLARTSVVQYETDVTDPPTSKLPVIAAALDAEVADLFTNVHTCLTCEGRGIVVGDPT